MRRRTRRIQAAILLAVLSATTWLIAEPRDVLEVAGPVATEHIGPKPKSISLGDGSVSSKTGAYNYTFPIEVPPGRSGMKPALSLRYSSDQPLYGSVVGAGWSLPIAAIERDWSLGASAPERWTSGLAGGRELVETTEPAPTGARTFRAQSDGSFARYQYFDATDEWRVLLANGRVLHFGESGYMEGGYASFDDWMPITRSVDAFGNEVRYFWSALREDGEGPVVDARLDRIEYTHHAGGPSHHAEVLFDYDIPHRCAPGAIRVGASLSYRGGERRIRGRDKLIAIRTRVATESAFRDVRTYTLGYDQNAESCGENANGTDSPRRVLSSITVSATSPETLVTTLPPVTFTYAGQASSASSYPAVGLPSSPTANDLLPAGKRNFPPWGGRSTDSTLIDLDGDGRPDFARATTMPSLSGTACALEWYKNLGLNSAGEYEFGNPQTVQLPTWPWRDSDGVPDADEFCSLSGQLSMYADPGYPTEGYPGAYVLYSFNDMNRDGVADLSVGLSGVESALLNFGWPSSTDCPVTPSSAVGGTSDDPGFPDPSQPEMRQPVAQLPYCHRWEVYANVGQVGGDRSFDFSTAFYAPSPVYAEAHDETLLPSYTLRSSRQAVADVTGDGYPDFVRVDTVANDPSASRWIVYPFNGTGLEPGFIWGFDGGSAFGFYPDESADIDDPQNAEDYHTVTLAALWDMNADGLPDLYRVDASGDLEILYNREGGFTAPRLVELRGGATFSNYLTRARIDITTGSTDATREDLGYSIDAHRDRRLDLVTNKAIAGGLLINLGDGFLTWQDCPPLLTCSPPAGAPSEMTQSTWRQIWDRVDADGDGFQDLVAQLELDGSPGVQLTNQKAPPGHLIAIDNGRGLVTDIAYAALGDAGAVTIGDGEHPSSRWVVKSLTATHQFGGAPPSTTTYQYNTPVRTPDVRGLLGFRGFESVTATAPSGASTVTRFDYTVDWSGRAVSSLVYPNGSANPSSIVDSSWQVESLSLGAATPIEFFHAKTSSYVCEHLDASGATNYYDETTCRAQINPRVKFAERVPLLDGTEVIARVPGWSFDAEQISATELEGFYQFSERSHIYTADTYRVVPVKTDKRAGTATGGPGAWNVPATRTGLAEHTYDSSLRMIELTCTAREASEVSASGGVDPSLGACAAFGYDTLTGQLTRTMKPEQYHKEVVVGGAQPFDAGTSYAEVGYKDTGQDPLSIHQVYPVYTRNALGHQVITRSDLGTGVVLETSGPNIDEGGHVVIDGFGRVLETWVNSSGTFNEPTDPVVPMRSAVFEYTDTPGPDGRVIVGKFDSPLSDSTSTLGWPELHTYVDGAGRTIKEVEWQYDLSGGGLQVVSENRWAYDKAGNLVTATGPDPSQQSYTVTVDYTYQHDSLGRQVCALRPDGSGAATIHGGRTSRVLELVPDGIGGGTCANPQSSSTDAAAAKTTIGDVFGRVVEVRERVDSTSEAETRYEYSPRGDLSKITRTGETAADDVVTEMSYDWAGNRLAIDRHERTWSYAYDRNANLVAIGAPVPKKGSPTDYVTSFVYDALDRQIERLYPVADLSTAELDELAVGLTTYSYDTARYGIGRLAQVTSPFATVTLDYNARGLPVSENRSFDLTAALGLSFSLGDSYTEVTAWNAFDQPQTSQNDAVGAQVFYDWERLPSVLNDVSLWGPEIINAVLLERNAAGLVTKAKHSAHLGDDPNTRDVTFTRDQLGRVLSETSNDPADQKITQTLAYGGSDEVQAMAAQVGTIVAPRSFTYSYDDRHQLTAADDDIDYSAAFAYTRTGKLASAFVAAPTGPGTLTFPRDVVYQYASDPNQTPPPKHDDPVDPEIPIALLPQNGSAFETELGYDIAGNLTSRTVDGQTFGLRYDGANRLRVRTLPSGAEELYYYHEGSRWLAVTRDAAGTIEKVRFWMGGTEIVYLCNSAGCTKDETRATLSIAGRDWVRVDIDSSGNPTNNVLHQSGLGHLLGVYSAVHDPSTSTTDYQLKVGFQYGPFGEILETGSAPLASPEEYLQRFNGKELDTATGLSYYGHRYYDPVTLAWNRADPFYRFLPEAAGTDSRLGNLYTFSLNNPVRYIDPDGLSPGNTATVPPVFGPHHDCTWSQSTKCIHDEIYGPGKRGWGQKEGGKDSELVDDIEEGIQKALADAKLRGKAVVISERQMLANMGAIESEAEDYEMRKRILESGALDVIKLTMTLPASIILSLIDGSINSEGGTPSRGGINSTRGTPKKPGALLPGLRIDDKQFGKKIGKHARDFGLNPADPSTRMWLKLYIGRVAARHDEVRQGAWHPRAGGGNDYIFYRRKADVVVSKPSGAFVTILKDGQRNTWFKKASRL